MSMRTARRRKRIRVKFRAQQPPLRAGGMGPPPAHEHMPQRRYAGQGLLKHRMIRNESPLPCREAGRVGPVPGAGRAGHSVVVDADEDG